MPDDRRIVIELVAIDGEDSGDGDNIVNQSTKTSANDKKKESSTKTLKSVIANQVYEQVKSLTKQTISAGLNRYFALSENYIAENIYNNATAIIGKSLSFGATVFAGAKVGGAVGGATGIIVGAGIAAAGWGISEVISGQNRMSGYYRSLNATNIQTEYSQRRAGLYDGSKGTEN